MIKKMVIHAALDRLDEINASVDAGGGLPSVTICKNL